MALVMAVMASLSSWEERIEVRSSSAPSGAVRLRERTSWMTTSGEVSD